MSIPLWLDCDPGHDDAMAIILAGYSPTVTLLGISVVAGNQLLQKVTQNALDVLHASGLDHVNVVAGQAKPLLRPHPMLCPEIHGESGLDGPQGGRLLPLSTKAAVEGKAVIVMFDAIQRAFRQQGTSGVRVRLVCTGSLTNAALLLTLYPEVIPMIEVVIMGGCMGIGNTGPVMEFNIQVDPEAAKVVFESGVLLTMVPLEVTHTVLVTRDVLRKIAGAAAEEGSSALDADAVCGSGASAAVSLKQGIDLAALALTRFRGAIVLLLLFFADTYFKVFGFSSPPLHDPCAVAFVIAPNLFKVEEMRVDIEVQSGLSSGQTVCDKWHTSSRPKNCRVAQQVDTDAFWELMIAAVAAADGASPMNNG